MNKKNIYRLKIGFFMLFLVVVDQVSKYLANTHLNGKNELIIINKVLSLYYLDGGNRGAAWGMFSGKIVMFIIFTIIAIFVKLARRIRLGSFLCCSFSEVEDSLLFICGSTNSDRLSSNTSAS